MHASKRSVDLSTGAAVFLACAAVVAGVGGWYRGTVPVDMAVGAGMLAVGVLASQRTMWLHGSPTEAGALSNAGLFALATGAKIGGVDLGIAPMETAGEALFLIAIAYYLVRAYGR
ncbi:hypothetical protein [Halobaculum magnesiiphilum]|uniref:Uncharacterized protein n=1 Tax=Halobaculum magnesiiphilum TaxID=1017351 RepID=A0A8T8WC14_9EURY|nr:hypothetical protein [Halobaculum magnesiiphilum]QZP37390.1 hypothetical protein K6T50_14095 [Halobaculum magnesiiphilum]